MNNDTAPRNLLTLDEVCDIARITKSGYRHLRAIGRAPRAVRMGRRLYFDRADIDSWLASRAIEVTR